MSKKKKCYSKYKSKMRERERVNLYVDIHSDVPPPPLSAERRIGWLGECERWFLIRGRTGLRESRSCSTSEHHILCFLKILKYTKSEMCDDTFCV